MIVPSLLLRRSHAIKGAKRLQIVGDALLGDGVDKRVAGMVREGFQNHRCLFHRWHAHALIFLLIEEMLQAIDNADGELRRAVVF